MVVIETVVCCKDKAPFVPMLYVSFASLEQDACMCKSFSTTEAQHVPSLTISGGVLAVWSMVEEAGLSITPLSPRLTNIWLGIPTTRSGEILSLPLLDGMLP